VVPAERPAAVQLNGDKSEVVFLGTAVQLWSAANITTVKVTGSTLPVALQLKSLDVTIDCHARNVAKACNFHARALRHVRSLLTDDVARTVACSIVASRLDNCNALLCGAPATTFNKLQRTHNNLARVVCHCRGSTDTRPLLRSLHWLPVRQRVIYKVTLLTHKVRATATPAYLSDLVQTLHVPSRALRSSDAPLLVVPRHRPNSLGTLFLLHPSGTLYLMTLDCARAFPQPEKIKGTIKICDCLKYQAMQQSTAFTF